MVFRWNSIFKIRMVCECDMEACNASFFKHWNKYLQLILDNTCISVVRILLTDGKLVIDWHIRQFFADGRNSLHCKTGTVFGSSAVFIGAVVVNGRTETSTHTVTVDLDHIKSCFFCENSGSAESRGDLFYFFVRHIRNIWSNLII